MKGGWRNKEGRVCGVSQEWRHCPLGALSQLGHMDWVLFATAWGICDVFGTGSRVELSSSASYGYYGLAQP